MKDDDQTANLKATNPRTTRGIKPAAVDIIRKKNWSDLANDGGSLRLRMAALKIKHERLGSDVSSLEAELEALRLAISANKIA
ncbi:MAG: hypothetical protein ABL898_02735 [Hyphomicrobiaceae bacterium]|nr:hypothetical protein [Hyphomicrobiaceae bacterium]